MKRLAFVTIVLIVIASTSGCRRGLRLWGCRGARCAPAYGTMAPMPAPTPQPPMAYPACPPACPPPCVSYPACPDPCGYSTTAYDCGCETTSGPAYTGYSGCSPEIPVSDSGYNLQPGEYMVSPSTDAMPPANVPPTLPSTAPTGFNG